MLSVFSYFKEILLIALVLSLIAIVVLTNNIKGLKKELAASKKEYNDLRIIQELQNASILAQKTDYEAKLKQLPREITKIQMRYQVIYKDIRTITKDKNATCETSIANLDNFTF